MPQILSCFRRTVTQNFSGGTAARTPLIALLLSLALGCDKKNEESIAASATEDAGAPAQKKSALDPELSRAMQSATENAGTDRNRKEDGPPPNGVFAPGAADSQIRLGDAPKVTLGAEGGMPRQKLGGEVKPGLKRAVKLRLVLNIANSELPVDLGLALETKAEAAAVKVGFKITSAVMAAGPGSGEEAKAALGALKGSEISYTVAPSGARSAFSYKLGSAKSSGVIQVLIAAKDVLASVTQAFPDKPVGPDAFWMVTSRQGVWDLDMVSYDMVKVVKVEGNAVTLSLNTKRYAASPTFNTPFVQADAPLALVQLEAPGQAQLTYTPGEFFPTSGSVNGRVDAGVAPLGDQNAMGRAQMVQASWTADLN